MKRKQPQIYGDPFFDENEIVLGSDQREVKLILDGRTYHVGLNQNYPGQLVIIADDSILVHPVASNMVTVRMEREL